MTNLMERISNHFKRGDNVNALQTPIKTTNYATRLAEIEKGIDRGEGDVVSLLAERDTVRRQMQAEKILADKKADAAYKAKLKARQDAFMRDLNKELEALWRLMPELRWTLIGLLQLEERLDEVGDGRSWDQMSGIPFGSPGRLLTAISQELAGTRLIQEAFVEGEASKPVIGAIQQQSYRLVDRGPYPPPPGFSGIWNHILGQPDQS